MSLTTDLDSARSEYICACQLIQTVKDTVESEQSEVTLLHQVCIVKFNINPFETVTFHFLYLQAKVEEVLKYFNKSSNTTV